MLTSINLHRNSIGYAGAIALAHALEKNSTLASIDLGLNEIGHYGSLFLAQALKKNITLTSIEPFKRVVECNAGIQGMLERRAVDTEEVAIKGKELEMLQQTYDRAPSSLSKYYLAVLLEADYADQSSDNIRSFLKTLDRLFTIQSTRSSRTLSNQSYEGD